MEKKLTQHQIDVNWFVMMAATLLFGIFWMLSSPTVDMLAFTTVAFMLFLHALIRMEMNDIKAQGDAH